MQKSVKKLVKNPRKKSSKSFQKRFSHTFISSLRNDRWIISFFCNHSLMHKRWPSPNLFNLYTTAHALTCQGPTYFLWLRENNVFARLIGVIWGDDEKSPQLEFHTQTKVTYHLRDMDFRVTLGETDHCAYLICTHSLVFLMSLYQKETVQLNESMHCIRSSRTTLALTSTRRLLRV